MTRLVMPARLQRKIYIVLAVFALTATSLIFTTQSARAHARLEVGPYMLILGWENEPVIVGDRNALVLSVHDMDGAPIENLEGSLEVNVLYAGRSFLGFLNPTSEAGHYRMELLPTVRGQFEVHLVGQIGETHLDHFLEPEEVLPARTLQFPEPVADPLETQAELDQLRSSVTNSQRLAAGGLIAGLLGLILAGLALVRMRKS